MDCLLVKFLKNLRVLQASSSSSGHSRTTFSLVSVSGTDKTVAAYWRSLNTTSSLKYHQPQLVDCSYTAYTQRLRPRQNPTNRSWWFVHTLPTHQRPATRQIPPTAVGGLFIHCLHTETATPKKIPPTAVGGLFIPNLINIFYSNASNIRFVKEPREHIFRLCMNYPPTAVGGIHDFA